MGAIVIDEADALLKDHPMEELDALFNAIPMMKSRSLKCSHPIRKDILVAASATADSPIVGEFARRFMHSDWSTISTTNASMLPNHIIHTLLVCPEVKLFESLKKILHASPQPTQALIFANDPYRVQTICSRLGDANIIAAPLSGNVTKEDRQEILLRLRDGRVSVVVSTDLSARGLDLPDVSHVINFDLPLNTESYLHRAGRCGRAGRPGIVVNIASGQRMFIPLKLSKHLKVPLYALDVHHGQLWVGKHVK